jgi:hypothetical protein
VETTEKIVEAYVRYVRGWATIPNIKCGGQFEIDLIAVDPRSLDRYHIESGISGSDGFSRLLKIRRSRLRILLLEGSASLSWTREPCRCCVCHRLVVVQAAAPINRGSLMRL